MNKLMVVMVAGVLAVLAVIGLHNSPAAAVAAGQKVNVVIEYGDGQPPRTVEAAVAPGQTVLGVLQTVATVETHPVDQHVFVTAIDGVQGKRGEMAWYYTIDGRNADQLAVAKVVDHQVGQITWTYRQDVCSCKVDKK